MTVFRFLSKARRFVTPCFLLKGCSPVICFRTPREQQCGSLAPQDDGDLRATYPLMRCICFPVCTVGGEADAPSKDSIPGLDLGEHPAEVPCMGATSLSTGVLTPIMEEESICGEE